MTETMAEELKGLKERYNKLVLIVRNDAEQIRERDERIRRLQDELSRREKVFSHRVISFFRSFGKVMASLTREELFIPYANKSKYSDTYMKVKKEDFEEKISQFTRMDRRRFIELCIMFDLIMSEENRRKCTYKNGESYIYFISKQAIELLKDLDT